MIGKAPNPPASADVQTRYWMNWVVNAISKLQPSASAPDPPSNLQVSALPLGNVVNFTGSDADQFILYHSTTADISTAMVRDIGQSVQFDHYVGLAGVTVFYWVKARNKGLGLTKDSGIVGPVSAVTLGNAVVIPAPPPPPPIRNVVTVDTATGHQVYGLPSRGRYL